MMTWFDILLVTLLAIATALGVRRGLAGLAWGLGGMILAFMANLMGLGTLPSLVIALLFAVAMSVALRRILPHPLEQPWHVLAGGLGGLLLGTVLILTIALSFPLATRVTPAGKQSLYPSPDLAPGLYRAVADSAIQQRLSRLWTVGPPWQTLILPDRKK